MKNNVTDIRKDFPILSTQVNGKPLVYFDNGASAQKPQAVIDSISKYYSTMHANIHRGVHTLSQNATQAYEDAREAVKKYINAQHSEEIIITRGTTESINLVAHSFVKKGDEVIISGMEHHSNIVPWQLAEVNLKVVKVKDNGELDLEDFKSKLSKNTKLVAITHVSNTLGTINPVEEIIALAHALGVKVLLDGAQAVPHMKVDVQKLDCDFYAFSAHKMYGPTGIGILYGKRDLLNAMPPYQGGGDMIKHVTFEKTTYNDLPHKFEAGTPAISEGIALGAAVEYLNKIDWDWAAKHEEELLAYATEEIKKIEGVKVIGEAKHKAGVLSFVVEGAHHYDIGTLLDQMGIAIRTGHHCTEPLMHRFDISGTARASFAFYNTKDEVKIFIDALKRSLKMLR
ncbi:MAG: cysteine desulfurase [Bacteroidetes bacterium]|nr:cysteine desulfurase [Bacteroidota bacterium]